MKLIDSANSYLFFFFKKFSLEAKNLTISTLRPFVYSCITTNFGPIGSPGSTLCQTFGSLPGALLNCSSGGILIPKVPCEKFYSLNFLFESMLLPLFDYISYFFLKKIKIKQLVQPNYQSHSLA